MEVLALMLTLFSLVCSSPKDSSVAQISLDEKSDFFAVRQYRDTAEAKNRLSQNIFIFEQKKALNRR